MVDPTFDRVETKTLDVRDELVRRLKELVPAAFSEGKLDVETLKQLLGEGAFSGPERYRLTWAGKEEAIRLLQRSTWGTLVPVPEESLDWESTQNVIIEGENLEVLKLLLKPYYGRVKLIYIDPPYNTGNDFIYKDDYHQPLETYLRLTAQKDENGLLTSNPETGGRYHSAWLSMMYPRLWLARELLREDGIIFVSIDDHEVHNLRLLMDEVFGEEHFVAQFVWKSRRSEDTRAKTGVSVDHEYIVCYRRSESGSLRGAEKDLSKFSNPDNDPRGPWRSADLTGLATRDRRPNLHYDLIDPETNINYGCPPKGWRFDPKTMQKKIAEKRILFPPNGQGRPRLKLFLNEMKSLYKNISSVLLEPVTADGTREVNSLLGDGIYDFPKPSGLLKLLVQQVCTDDDDIVLDFFAGSGTMAQAVMEANQDDAVRRRYILVQLPEPTPTGSVARTQGFTTIADIAKERARRVAAQIKQQGADGLDLGFRVYRLDNSQFKPWREPEGDALVQLEFFVDGLREGWNADTVIAEVAIKEAGFGLNYLVEKIMTLPNTVYRVTDPDRDQHFYISLDDQFLLETAFQVPLTSETLLVVRDIALDDATAANLATLCRLKTI